MRFLLRSVAFLLLVGLLCAALLLGWGHVQIRRVRPPLPAPSLVLNPDPTLELPVRLSWIDTATQRMARSAVLEPSLDPDPQAPYAMSHPSFVVEWQDGRIFLIDLGMDTSTAVDFGLSIELLADAEPIEPHTATSARLGEHRRRVAGIGFTHLHTDHTDGLAALCADLVPRDPGSEPIPVFQHHHQLSQVNHTTWSAKRALRDAGCVQPRTLGVEGGLVAIPDFPGLYAIPAGGHTPGSTIFVVQLRTWPGGSDGVHEDVQTWIITGDVVNHFTGVEHGIPKPRLYGWLAVPEDPARLAALREYLQDLWQQPGVELLVPHDRGQIESTGLPRY